MKVESCRKCGRELNAIQNCSVCRSPIQFNCKNCGIDTETQVHLDCYQLSFEKEVLRVKEAIAE